MNRFAPGNKLQGGALERVIPGQRFFVGDRVKLNPNHLGAGRFSDCIGTVEHVQPGHRADLIYYTVRWAPCRERYALQNPSFIGQRALLPVNNNNGNMNIDGGRRTRRSRRNRKTRRRLH